MGKVDNFYKEKLKNGLTVIFEKRNLPVVSVLAGVNFGGGYENAEEKGIAHVIEHMLFKGTKKRNYREIMREIEKKGGVLNGYTGEEMTAFWNKLNGKHLATGIDVVSDIISNPRFPEEEFEKEKRVVIEEIKMHYDTPLYHVHNKIKELLYEKPFGMSIAGTKEIVAKLTRKKIMDFFNRHYKTDKMILCVVGRADFTGICETAEKIPTAEKSEFKFPAVKKINQIVTEKRKGIDQTHFIFGFHFPTQLEKERYTYNLALTYLAGGGSSVLFDEIREKRGLVYAIQPEIDIGRNYGYATIYCGTKKESVKEIKEIILREIKNLKNLQKKDFEETKEQMIGLRKLEEENSTNVMNSLFTEELGGGAEEYYKFDERINSLNIGDIRKIKLKGFSCFTLIPD